MGTKIIIICGILLVATVLLGLFRLRWLRKCYDKARAEKKDVLEREQKALAFKQLDIYYKAKAATWKSMGIAVAVIAILGTAVWGIGRIAQAQKVEKGQAKVEKSEESFSEGLFYYFSYDGNLERFIVRRKNNLEKAQAEYQEATQNLDKAMQSGDLTQVTKYNIEVDCAKEKVASAQKEYDNLNEFVEQFGVYCFGIFFYAIFLFVLNFCLAFMKGINLFYASSLSEITDILSIILLTCIPFVCWSSLVLFFLVICNILIYHKRREVIKKVSRR